MKTTVYRKIFAAFLFAACLAQPLSATDYYVKTGGSNGDTGLSLDHAFATIAQAVTASADNDVIYISGTVTAGIGIATKRTLTFIGINGATIDPNFGARCVDVSNVNVAGSNITIKNITLTRGYRASGGNGGAVAAANGIKMSLIDCIFTNNFAGRSTAIDANGTELYLRGCTFTDNNTATTEDNANLNFSPRNLIWIQETTGTSTAYMENCVFKDNKATDYIIENAGSSLTMVNCQVKNNSAGGLLSSKTTGGLGELYVRGCLFKENASVKVGAGINSANQTLYIEGSAFIGNSTTGDNLHGGAIRFAEVAGSKFTVINSTIAQNNTTNGRGTGIYIEGPQSTTTEISLINTTLVDNYSARNNNDASGLMIYDGGTFAAQMKIYNSIIENNKANYPATTNTIRDIQIRSGKNAGLTPEEQGHLLIYNSFIQYIYANNAAGITVLENGDVVNSYIGGRTFTGIPNNYQASGIDAYNTTYNAYPLASSSSLAYNLGDASLLSAAGYHTDQLKQYRSFANDKCHAGATEWVQSYDIVPTTSITATEIGGYSGGSLKSFETVTLTDAYSLDNLASLQNALGSNELITNLHFEGELPSDISTDYFTAINPNALKHIVDEQAPESWTNVVSTTGFLTPLSLTDGFPHNYTDVNLSTVPKFNYTMAVAPKQWYPMGFPFELSDVIGHMSNGDIKDKLKVYDGTTGSFWVKTYDENDHFAYSSSIVANESYIIQFPPAFEDAKITFVSGENPNLAGTYTPPAEGYTFVSNPSIENLELSATHHCYIYDPEANVFNLLEGEETATIKPFEAFVVAGTNVESPFKSISIADMETGLKNIQTGDPVTDIFYYTLQGTQVAQPTENGMYLLKKVHASKSVSVTKIIYRKH